MRAFSGARLELVSSPAWQHPWQLVSLVLKIAFYGPLYHLFRQHPPETDYWRLPAISCLLLALIAITVTWRQYRWIVLVACSLQILMFATIAPFRMTVAYSPRYYIAGLLPILALYSFFLQQVQNHLVRQFGKKFGPVVLVLPLLVFAGNLRYRLHSHTTDLKI